MPILQKAYERLADAKQDYLIFFHGLDLTSPDLARSAEARATKKLAKAEKKLTKNKREADRLRMLISSVPIQERNDRVRAYQAAKKKVERGTCTVQYWFTRGNVSRYRATKAGQK